MPTSGTLGWLALTLRDHAGLVAQASALAAGLVLLAVAVRTRPRPLEGVSPHVAQDGAHIALRAAVLLPLTAWLLATLDDAVTRFVPGLRVDLLGALPTPAQFVAYVVLVDLVDYGVHRTFHVVPWLWKFHAIHHAQTWVNPLTTTRTHPVELVLKRIVTWAPLLVLGGPHQLWPVWVAIDGFWGFFVHSGLPVSLGPLRYVVVSPTFHAIHHSAARQHRDVNLGERLSVWDTLFGTARHDAEGVVITGVDDATFPLETEAGLAAAARTWMMQFAYPFRQLWIGRRSRSS